MFEGEGASEPLRPFEADVQDLTCRDASTSMGQKELSRRQETTEIESLNGSLGNSFKKFPQPQPRNDAVGEGMFEGEGASGPLRPLEVVWVRFSRRLCEAGREQCFQHLALELGSPHAGFKTPGTRSSWSARALANGSRFRLLAFYRGLAVGPALD